MADGPPKQWSYPPVRRDDSTVTELADIRLEDPYRWLEDPDSEETGEFVKVQNEITTPFLANCSARNKFHARYLWCRVSLRVGNMNKECVCLCLCGLLPVHVNIHVPV